MSAEKILQHMEEVMPLSKSELDWRANGERYGLIIVDEVNGFATVGAGKVLTYRTQYYTSMTPIAPS